MTRLVAAGCATAVMVAAVATSYAWRSRVSSETQVAECRGDAVVKPPDMPENVLLQVQVIDPHGRPAGYRIYRDGRYEARSAETDWSPGTAMTSTQLDAIRSAIQKTNPDRLRGRYEPDRPAQDEDANIIQVDFGLDTDPRRVTVVRPCIVPEVDGLIQRMAEIFKQPQR
jgi:hypothetical protein